MSDGPIVPRNYQDAAVEKTFDWFRAHATGNPLIGLPTGTGKAVVIALLLMRIFERWGLSVRVLVLTHRKKLIEQNAQKMLKLWPGAPVGIHSAGLKKRDVVSPIIFGGIQSVASTIKRKGNVFGVRHIVIVDEAHLVPPETETTYGYLLEVLRAEFERVRVIGLTATAFRMRQGMLTDDGIFTDFSFNMTSRDQFNWFIRNGFLAPLIPRGTETVIDVSNVSVVAGEFNLKELEAASNVEAITIGAVREMLVLAADRDRWLVFGAGIAHCNSIGAVLEAHGVSNVVVHSKKGDAANDAAIEAFSSGKVRALVNADMLTTGFDCPEVDMIAMLRATRSPVLWVQMLGRGTRPADGKLNCLVLDYARNTLELGPINDPVIPRKPGDKTGMPPPMKECPACQTFNYASARLCIACEHPFEFETKVERQAGTLELVAGLAPRKREVWPVMSTYFRKYTKPGGKPSLRVTYALGAISASEFISIEHEHPYARKKARQWWEDRSGGAPMPETVDDALKLVDNLRKPKKLTLLVGGKYPEIASQEF